MAISVKDVYNTVLYAINKEQRGYIGPDEFNKFAKMAQIQIFEGYFSDLAHFSVSPKGRTMPAGYADLAKALTQKIDFFVSRVSLEYDEDNERFNLPDDFYRLDVVSYTPTGSYVQVPEVEHKDIYTIRQSSLMKPTKRFPIHDFHQNYIKVYPEDITSDVYIDYVRMPADPIWGYRALGTASLANTDGTLFYDAGMSTDFEIHDSDYPILVDKILSLAGLSTKDLDVVQYADQAAQMEMQVKKS